MDEEGGGVSRLATFEEASRGIARLDLRFGGHLVTEAERFRELRLFRNAKPDHVEAVVARAVRYFARRPNADELRQLLDDEWQGRVPVDPQDVTPAELVALEVGRIRERLGDGGAVTVDLQPRRENSVSRTRSWR
jgi:hypothetical protein